MELTQEQLARLKAQSSVGGNAIRLPVLDRISLNGNCDAVEDENGVLKRPSVDYRKMMMKKAEKDVRPEQISLGSPIEVIFVKIRRRLVARDSDGKQVMSTTQHNDKDQIVGLWKDGKCIETARASDLREKYKELRTIQEVYILLKGELNLLIVKGSAFGSDARDSKLPSFYEYLQNINKDGIFANTTILGGVLEKGKKDYYTMTFEKGRSTTQEEMLLVLENSDTLTPLMNDYDKENTKGMIVNTEERSLEQIAKESEELEEIPFD